MADPGMSDKVTWLAKEIFSAFPSEVSGLKFYLLDCQCIYYQRVLPDGVLDPEVGIYRDPGYGPCDACICQPQQWKARVEDEVVIYAAKFERQ
jgi:hypothetical protein